MTLDEQKLISMYRSNDDVPAKFALPPILSMLNTPKYEATLPTCPFIIPVMSHRILRNMIDTMFTGKSSVVLGTHREVSMYVLNNL